jgi:polar amino acid transport system permease protein
VTVLDTERELAVTASADDQEVVNLRHPVRWVAAALILLAAGFVAWSLAHNENIKWAAVRSYLTDPAILHGVVVTLELTVVAMVVGIVLGIIVAVLRLSTNPVLRSVSGFYVWFFRGTPLLVQLIFWFNFGLLFPRIGILGFSADTNSLITPWTAAMLGLGLNEGAYYSEIVRAGILSVPHGQATAASSLGMRAGQTMRKIVLPQAMRVIIPPTGNDSITMLKNTALVSVIGGAELLSASKDIYARNFQVMELLIVASIWYLAITSVASIGQYFLERRFSRGSGAPAQQDGLVVSVWHNLTKWRLARSGQ